MNGGEPIRVVVAAVDFGESSGRVLSLARSVSHSHGARLHVVHVVHDLQSLVGFFVTRVSLAALEEEIVREARERLASLCRTCLPSSAPHEERVIGGVPATALSTYAREHRAELLVVGRHGQSKPEHAFFGSTANRLLQCPPCPILVVP